MKKLFLYTISLLFFATAQAQVAPSIIWQASYGGEAGEGASDVIYTSNGNLLVCGSTSSKNFYINFRKGEYYDYMLLNIDVTTNALNWSQVYGGSVGSNAYNLYEVDGGFFVAGRIYGGGKDVTRYDSLTDFWSIKTDYYGKLVWDRTIGGSGYDYYSAGIPTKDGGYVYAGKTYSTDGDIKSRPGFGDGWVVKTNDAGTIEWQRFLYDDTSIMKIWPYPSTWVNDILQTKDEGYIVSGSHLDSGTLYANAMVSKLNKNGDVVWQQYYGGDSVDILYGVSETVDGSYILVGETKSSTGDLDTNYGDIDVWVVKINSIGVMQWRKVYGGGREDRAREIKPCVEGGYLFVGTTASSDGMVIGNHSQVGTKDMWVVKIDDTGKILWQKCLGGTDEDGGNAVIQLPDASFVLVGSNRSVNGDATGNYGESDVWVVRLSNPAASIESKENQIEFSVYPNPSSKILTVQLKENTTGTIQLLDVKGRVLIEQSIEKISKEYQLNTSKIASGIYTLVVRTEKGWQAKQVIVQN